MLAGQETRWPDMRFCSDASTARNRINRSSIMMALFVNHFEGLNNLFNLSIHLMEAQNHENFQCISCWEYSE